MQTAYSKLKLFTNHLDEGGELCVVPDADDLSEDQINLIAARLSTSHCVFLKDRASGSAAATLKSVGPLATTPVDANAILGAATSIGMKTRAASARLSCEGIQVTCVFDRIDKVTGDVHFMLPQMPQKLDELADPSSVASALGLDVDQLGHDDFGAPVLYQLGAFGGQGYHLVPLKDAEQLAEIRLQRRGWAGLFGQHAQTVCTFAPMHSDELGAHIAARVFGPQFANWEDQAHGASAACLAMSLIERPHIEDGQHQLTIHQGQFLGANGHIEVKMLKQNGNIERLGLGGKAVIVAEGHITL